MHGQVAGHLRCKAIQGYKDTSGKHLSPNKPLQLTWEEFLTHFKHKFCSTKNLLELENQLLTLKKGSMFLNDYTNAFTDKLEFALRVVPDKLSKLIGTPRDTIVGVFSIS